jgi:Ca2+-binding RTX toxin-like protein
LELSLLSDLSTFASFGYDNGTDLNIRLSSTLNAGASANWHVIDLGYGQDAHHYSAANGFGAFYLAYDDISSRSVLVFRGTDSFTDLPADMAIFFGQLGPLSLLFENIVVAAKSFAAGVGAQLYITGHSLGGALAESLYQLNNGGSLVGGAGFGSPGIFPPLIPTGPNSSFVHVTRTADAVGTYGSYHYGKNVAIVDDNFSSATTIEMITTAHSDSLYNQQIKLFANSTSSIGLTTDQVTSLHFLSNIQNNIVSTQAISAYTATIGGAGSDVMDGSASTAIVRLDGGGGNDTLTGGQAQDYLDGGSGNDVISDYYGNNILNGGAGNDQIANGLGNDTVTGGVGDDYIYVFGGNDSIDGGSGNDQINFSGNFHTSAVIVNLSITGPQSLGGGQGIVRISGIEAITGTNFYGDTLTGDSGPNLIGGLGGNDLLSGGNGNDTAGGGDGKDTVTGGAGNDNLRGDAGADSVSGGDGNDILLGDAGNDVLAGGRGTDVFLFLGTGFGHDTIVDFRPVEDDIRLVGAGFTSFTDIMAHASQVGSHVVITNAAGDSLQLNNVLLSSLQSADFLFA